jgi:hypothetical protein
MIQKLHKLLAMAAIALSITFSAKAQTISDFENLTLLKADTFWNGISNKLGTTFSSGNAIFNNYYDTSYGGFWSAGFAYTNVQDSIHGDYHHLYSSKALKGYNGSNNYVSVAEDAYNNRIPIIKLSGNAAGKVVSGFYISNSTYAFNTILNGNFAARKFGDTTGTHSGLPQGSQPDWFKVTIKNWLGGVKSIDSIDFYLADYRFSNNAQDYIVKDWTWVDLTSLGNVDSLSFHLSSSDNSFGFMNTPAFFCMDNFTTADVALGINEIGMSDERLSVYPNPTSSVISVRLSVGSFKAIEIGDLQGRKTDLPILFQTTDYCRLNTENMSSGIYFIKTIDNKGFEQVVKFVKQ